jgi:enolase
VVLGIADAGRVKRFLDARGDTALVLAELAKVGVGSLDEALANMIKSGFSAFFSHRSTEGSSEFLPYMPLLYGSVCKRLWFKAGAPNGERNLQNYNPLIRAEEEMRDAGVKTVVTGFGGLPKGVIIPAVQKMPAQAAPVTA